MNTLWHRLFCAGLLLLLLGCSNLPARSGSVTSPTQSTAPATGELTPEQQRQRAKELESAAELATEAQERFNNLVEAGWLYGQAAAADDLLRILDRLGAITAVSSSEMQWQIRVLQARWHILRREPLLALSRIQSAAPAIDVRWRFYTALTRALALEQLQDGVSAIQALVAAAQPPLSAPLEAQRVARIHQLLQSTDLYWLEPTRGLNPTVRGWLDLGEIGRKLWPDSQSLEQALNGWKRSYPRHPGMDLIDDLGQQAQALLADAPSHIGLLLPLSGRLAEPAAAIRDGFMAAYFNRGENRLRVDVFDTHARGAKAAFDEAVAAGVDLIVGPLQRDSVQQTLQHNAFQLPQLALNAAPQGYAQRPWLLSLALPPEDDAASAARLALAQGHTRLVALRADSDWAARAVQALEDSLLLEGGSLLDSMRFESTSESYPQAIQAVLQLERSRDRAQRVQRTLGRDIEFETIRRQDADALFLAAGLDDARQIRPQIKFYQAADLPIYASGRLFDGQVDEAERDLNGVYFCSSPWLLGSNENWRAQRQQFQEWDAAADSRWARFHALGHDAYLLATQARAGRWPSNVVVSGASGDFHLLGRARPERRLPCAVFREGRPEVVAQP
nr:penicillin-binding protein activator [Oceanococcus sp. HetDA_MAG_MS8]